MSTNPNKIFPALPAGFSLPFYYASVNAIWMYYKVSPKKVTPYLTGIALKPALFDGQALVLLHFQRYTGFISSLMSVVNEAQFNIIAYPSALTAQAPERQFRLQPPRSKRGALHIELRERCGNGAPGRFCPA